MNHSLVFSSGFHLVDEYSVICVWITRNVCNSVALELTVCIFCRFSEDSGRVFFRTVSIPDCYVSVERHNPSASWAANEIIK
jgi:hypothetical protein